jgi:hypothetical protein
MKIKFGEGVLLNAIRDYFARYAGCEHRYLCVEFQALETVAAGSVIISDLFHTKHNIFKKLKFKKITSK